MNRKAVEFKLDVWQEEAHHAERGTVTAPSFHDVQMAVHMGAKISHVFVP